ncbi:MAG: hypothetical protein V1664_00740 [Candidatus Uhrbacteria bacterium]
MPEKLFSDLPEAVQDFLLDPVADDWIANLARENKIKDNDSLALSEIVEEVVLGEEDLELLPSTIMAEVDCDWETARNLAIELAGNRLLPIASLVGDVAGQIKVWGGDLSKFANIKIVDLPKFSAEDYVEAALIEWNVKEFEGILRSRLIFILSAFVKGERKIEEIKAALLRSRKVGGMEFSEEVAERVVELIVERVATVPFYSLHNLPLRKGEEMTAVSASQVPTIDDPTPKITPSSPSQPPAVIQPPTLAAQAKKMEDFFQKSDEAEIAQATILVKEKAAMVKPAGSVNEVVERLVRETGLISPDEDFQKRLVVAVDSRWRGVRDVFATRDLLEKNREQGGLGLQGSMLVKVIETLEKMVEENNQVLQQAAVAQTKKDLQEKAAAKIQPSQPIQISENLPLSKPPAPTQKIPVMSPSSLPVSATGQRRVEDISFVRKLAGPIEELQNLSVTEFRRLSSDPHEAATKLRDKIELLEEQGFGKKIVGIKAWQASPINHLYLELSKEALISGRPIEEVCKARAERGEEVFSAAEIKAIASLNNDLRF